MNAWLNAAAYSAIAVAPLFAALLIGEARCALAYRRWRRAWYPT